MTANLAEGGGGPSRRDQLIVGACVVALGLPHLVAGPELMADDWVWVRNGDALGWWEVGASRLVSRPGEYGLFAFLFGLGGARPLVHALVLLLLRLVASLAVLHALARLVPARTARLVTLVWILAPSHLTIELWASTAQAWAAIASLAFGAVLFGDWSRGRRGPMPGLVLLGLAGTFYEVATPAIPVVAVLVDRAVIGRWRPPAFIGGVLAAAPAITWGVAHRSVYGEGVRRTVDLWPEHLAVPLGLGVPVRERAIALLILAAVLVIGSLLAVRVREGRSGGWAGAALGALAVTLAGAGPGLLAFTPPIGMGDRLTTVSAIGGAAFWVFAAKELLPPLSLVARAGAGMALIGTAVIIRVDALDEWIELEDETVLAVDRLGRAAAEAHPEALTVEGPLVDGELFYGLFDGWNATAAVQVDTGDLDLVVQVDIRCLRTGPLRDQPLEQDQQRAAISLPDCPNGAVARR